MWSVSEFPSAVNGYALALDPSKRLLTTYGKFAPGSLHLAAMHHKSTGGAKKISTYLQQLVTPYQIRTVRRFGECRPGETEIGDSDRPRSQQLWSATPQFHAILITRYESENNSNRLGGGGDGPDVEPSLVDAALICKEFLNIRHVIECGLLSGLLVRPDRCRWPGW